MDNPLLQAAALLIPLVIAIVFHEVAHGWVARMLGDPTAKDARRLSLNPLRHVDPIGTVILPGFLALVKAPIFGWAKPVPVDFRRLRNPRRDMMLVAAAGPGTNLLLAFVGAVLLGLLMRIVPQTQGESVLFQFMALNLGNFLLINVFLALFNLLPIPPFDGSHIVEGALPRRAARSYRRLRPYGFPLLFLMLLVIPNLFPAWNVVERIVAPPVQWAVQHYLALAAQIAGG